MINNLIIESPNLYDINKTKKIANCYLVDKDQPMSVSKAVEQFATYFKREGRFDHVQYTAHEDKNRSNVRAYIWTQEGWEADFAVGACSFRLLKDVDQNNNWSLQWIWFHPYYRCKGYLSAAWPLFVKKFGKDFHVEPPLSYEMEAFLKKMNHEVK